jgi:hypothetical protein
MERHLIRGGGKGVKMREPTRAAAATLVFFATIAVSLVVALPAAAAGPIVNGTFSTGDFTGWTAVSAGGTGATAVLTGGIDGDGYQAWLQAGTQNVYSTVSQTIYLPAGGRIAGYADWYNAEVSHECGFNDDAYVKVGSTVVWSANSCTTNHGLLGYQLFRFTATSAGYYTIQAGVRNVGDSSVASQLYVDDFKYLGIYKPVLVGGGGGGGGARPPPPPHLSENGSF